MKRAKRIYEVGGLGNAVYCKYITPEGETPSVFIQSCDSYEAAYDVAYNLAWDDPLATLTEDQIEYHRGKDHEPARRLHRMD